MTAARRAVINDTNEQLLNVYRQLKIDAEAVIAAVKADAEPCDKERTWRLVMSIMQK